MLILLFYIHTGLYNIIIHLLCYTLYPPPTLLFTNYEYDRMWTHKDKTQPLLCMIHPLLNNRSPLGYLAS